MRVAINAINSNLAMGGVDRYVIELLRHIDRITSANQYYLFYAYWQKFFKDIKYSNVKFIEMRPPTNKFLRALWQIFRFPIILRNYSPDLLHYANPTPFLWKVCPVVVTVHDMAEYYRLFKYGKLNTYLKRIILRLSMTMANIIITVSHFSKKDIINIGKVRAEKIRVIHQGVNLERFKKADCNEVAKKYSLPTNYLLFVGKLIEGKNVEAILYAFSRLQKAFKDTYSIVIVGGEGNAYPRIIQVIQELQLGDKVLLLEHVPEKDLPCLYRFAKVFVFPSLIEGFGLPVLEAMACGVPVVSSNATSLPEVCGEAALLTDPTDPDQIRLAIEKVLVDKTLASSLVRGGLHRIRDFSWKVTAQKTLAEYATLLSAG